MRKLVPLGVLLVLLVVLGAIKYTQIALLSRRDKAAKRNGPPPEVVGTAVAKSERWEVTLSAVGNVAAVRGVTVSSEMPGMVRAIHFKSGTRVAAGTELVELDTSVERGQVAAARARMELAESTVGRSRKLAETEAISKLQLDADEAAAKSARAEYHSLQAQIGRKVVRAPFAGRLGIRQVNLGQYLQPGTPIVVIESLGAVFVDFSLPQQNLDDVAVGMPVRARYADENEEMDGQVVALDPGIESATRSVKLRASVPDPHNTLRPGMFVSVRAILDRDRPVVAAPTTAVVHASYGDSVFVVEDKKNEAGVVQKDEAGRPQKVVRQQFVRVGDHRGDFAAITEGVKPGQELVTAGTFKLRNGARIIVDNSVKPKPSLAPEVENR